jgi:hypothetical protein
MTSDRRMDLHSRDKKNLIFCEENFLIEKLAPMKYINSVVPLANRIISGPRRNNYDENFLVQNEPCQEESFFRGIQ